jgi:PAS domain S-box-containing protein
MTYAADFRTLADAMPQLVWTARPDGSLEYLNDRWVDYTGYRADELGGDFSSVIHPEDVAAVQRKWHEALTTCRQFETEYRMRRASDGTYRWFLGRGVPVVDEYGHLERWIGTATDIDEQKRANEKLKFVLDAASIFASAGQASEICGKFARLSVQRFADWCAVVLYDNNAELQLCALEHRDATKTRELKRFVDRYPVSGDPHFAQLLERGETTHFPAITDEVLVRSARDEQHLAVLRGLGLRSAVVAPLLADGDVIGGILLYTAESQRAFDESDVDVIRTLADRAAVAIANSRTLAGEQKRRRRLQFIGKAAEVIYESLDLTASFGELMRLIVATFGDFAVALRLEHENTVRVIAAAHHDSEKDDIARSLVGVRTMHTEAEKAFARSLREHKVEVRENLEPEMVAESMWPYLSHEILALEPRAAITVPLHSRGITYGAIIVYYSCADRRPAEADQELLAEIGRHASVAMENAEVFERERHMAQTLQDSLLPPSLPRLENIRFDAVYLPSASVAQVGGDWYDAWKLEDGAIVIHVGDVTGRGADAAVIMGKVRHLLAIAPSYERDPARILDTVESVLGRRYPEVIVTAFLGIITPDRQSMVFANAGHPLPLLRRSGGTEEIKADGLPIGLRRDAEPSQSQTVDLSDAKLLVLYTDGLTEVQHDIVKGFERLQDVVNSDAVLHTHNPARFIEESCLGGRADDDVAILTLSFETSKRWSFDAENARAAQDARTEFVQYLRAHVNDAFSISAAELVFGELIGNVVRHAPGSIDIDLDWSQERPQLHVIDRGPAFEAGAHLPTDILSESGRGLYIVGRLANNLKVEHVPGYGNHVTVELPLRRKLE